MRPVRGMAAAGLIVGERLRSARIRARFSQSEVARFMRVTKSKIVGWERGAIQPSPDEAVRLARVLSVDPASLFGRANLTWMGLDEATANLAARAFPSAPAPRGALRGHGQHPPPRLAPVRCGRCGRWIGLRADGCGGCPATSPQAA